MTISMAYSEIATVTLNEIDDFICFLNLGPPVRLLHRSVGEALQSSMCAHPRRSV